MSDDNRVEVTIEPGCGTVLLIVIVVLLMKACNVI